MAGVPTNATAVALNVTGVLPSLNAFITTYPCGDLPTTSSLNPAAGKVTPNLVLAQVSSRGSVCFFTNADIDLVVDVVGYTSSSAANRFTPSAPFRFTDTRDNYRTEVNAGQNGIALAANQTLVVQIAGVRGIPAAARAISANLTVVEATNRGFVTAWPCGDLPDGIERQLRDRRPGRQRRRVAAVVDRRHLHLLVELRTGDHRHQRLVELSPGDCPRRLIAGAP